MLGYTTMIYKLLHTHTRTHSLSYSNCFLGVFSVSSRSEIVLLLRAGFFSSFASQAAFGILTRIFFTLLFSFFVIFDGWISYLVSQFISVFLLPPHLLDLPISLPDLFTRPCLCSSPHPPLTCRYPLSILYQSWAEISRFYSSAYSHASRFSSSGPFSDFLPD